MKLQRGSKAMRIPGVHRPDPGVFADFKKFRSLQQNLLILKTTYACCKNSQPWINHTCLL